MTKKLLQEFSSWYDTYGLRIKGLLFAPGLGVDAINTKSVKQVARKAFLYGYRKGRANR